MTREKKWKMWNLITTSKQLTAGALGMINKRTDKHITKIPDDPNQHEIQKNTRIFTFPLEYTM